MRPLRQTASLFLLVGITACTETGLEPPGPEPAIPAPTYVELSVGTFHACALDDDGRAFCWGSNFSGQLGIGSTTPSEAPVQVQGGHRFSSISAGMDRTCGITTEGDLLCWGETLGAHETRLLPIPFVEEAVDFVSLDVTNEVCAITDAGGLYCGWSAKYEIVTLS